MKLKTNLNYKNLMTTFQDRWNFKDKIYELIKSRA